MPHNFTPLSKVFWPIPIGKEINMFVLIWSLLALFTLVGCGAQVAQTDNPQPKWTVENPNASAGATQGSSQREAKRQASAPSSLEALQSGQSTITPASSPVKDVYFGFDRYDLTEEARGILKANAEWLKTNPATRLQIEGHCDERGTVEYNLSLGAKRAETAKDYLVTLGIAADRLSTISYGEEIPLCREQTEACWEKNRRARSVIVSGRPTT
jgi:peptidoglycan-associated lipoprotein